MADVGNLATLSLGLSNEPAIAGAKATGAAFDEMGAKGEAAAAKITASSNPVTAAIMKQAVTVQQARAAWAAAGGDWNKFTSNLQQTVAATRPATESVNQLTASIQRMRQAAAQKLDLGLAAQIGALDPFQKSLARIEPVATSGKLSLGRLGQQFGNLAGSIAGTNPIVANLLSVMGNFAVGSAFTVGILGGLALIAVAYDKLTAGARKAREEQERLTKSLADQFAPKTGPQSATNLAYNNALQQQADAMLRLRLLQGTGSEIAAESAGLVPLGSSRGREIDRETERLRQANQALGRARAGGAGVLDTVTSSDDSKERKALRDKDLAEEKQMIAEVAALKLKALTDELAGIAKVQSLRQGGEDAHALLVASQQGAQAYQDQVDAIAVRNQLLAAGIHWYDAEYESSKRILEVKIAEGRETDRINKARETAASEAKAAAQRAADEAARPFKNMMRELQSEFATFFDNIFTKGIKSFGDLVSAIKDMFLKMIAELLAANLMKRLAGGLAAIVGTAGTAGAQGTGGAASGMAASGGLWNNTTYGPALRAASAGAAGGFVGYQVGQSVGSAGGGALAGAASGAATGFAIAGPVGALAGGLTGLVGGLLGGAQAAREAAAAMRQLRRDYTAAAAAFSHDDVAKQLADNAASAEQLRQMAYKIFGDIFTLIRDGGAALKQQYADIAAQEAKNAEIIKRNAQHVPEDLQVRLLSAQGQDKAAAALKLQHDQERERQSLIDSFGAEIDATEKATLALLDQVQAAEKLKAAQDSVSDSMLNMVEGYKLQATIFAASNPRAPGRAIDDGIIRPPVNTLPGGGEGPSGSGDLTINVVADGAIIGKAVLRNFKGTAQRQFGDSTKWSSIQ